MSTAAQWVAVVSTISCVFLLLSWIVLPIEKTSRHYLSISLTVGVTFMNVSGLANQKQLLTLQRWMDIDIFSSSSASLSHWQHDQMSATMPSRPTLCIPARYVQPRGLSSYWEVGVALCGSSYGRCLCISRFAGRLSWAGTSCGSHRSLAGAFRPSVSSSPWSSVESRSGSARRATSTTKTVWPHSGSRYWSLPASPSSSSLRPLPTASRCIWSLLPMAPRRPKAPDSLPTPRASRP